MICPDCQHDNITGEDDCAECGQPLVRFDPSGCELEQSIARHEVGVLNPRKPIMIAPTLSLREAVDEMVSQKIGGLLVTENDVLVGIITERDILKLATSDEAIWEQPVADVMTKSPMSIVPEESIAYALHAMDLGSYRHLPVVDSANRPMGIISIRDILRFLCVRFGETRATNK